MVAVFNSPAAQAGRNLFSPVDRPQGRHNKCDDRRSGV